MKRTVLFAAVAAAVLAPAALAGNATVYKGEFPDFEGSTATLKTVERTAGPFFKSFVARDVDVDCSDGAILELEQAFVRGFVPIGDRGRFKAKGSNGEETIKVKGEVGKRKAKGTFIYDGPASTPDGEVQCRDKLDWKAKT